MKDFRNELLTASAILMIVTALATCGTAARLVEAGESVENAIALVDRYARAVVIDVDDRLGTLARQGDLDPGRRVARAVLDEVAEGTDDHRAIGLNPDRRRDRGVDHCGVGALGLFGDQLIEVDIVDRR